jgi:hypothetical protein
MILVIPLDLNTNAAAISSNYGTIKIYDSSTQTLTINGISNGTANLSVYGFKSYSSTKAFSIQVNF